MKFLFISFILLLSLNLKAEDTTNYISSIQRFQAEMNAEFADSASSPLTKTDLIHFTSLEFFPINEKFCVKARFVLTPNESTFEMKTTTDRKPLYLKYAEIFFIIDSVQYKLNVYRNIDLTKKPGYEDYLFIPFTDASNGALSYGGGRYLDVRIPVADTLILDFNKAYNPYCCYNKKYSCPVPPSENDLPIEILAGVMKFNH